MEVAAAHDHIRQRITDGVDDQLLERTLALLSTIAQLASYRYGEHDRAYRAEVVRRLQNAGLGVEGFDPVAIPNGSAIDFVVRYEGMLIGVAIRKTGASSLALEDLRKFAGRRVLIVRKGRSAIPIVGVDAVIAARVRRYARWRRPPA